MSTSGSFIQCCPKTGSCPFYTSCSSNILVASNTTVPCDADSALACNTGLVVTADNDLNTGSYLACWQTSLGTTPFSILQDPDATCKLVSYRRGEPALTVTCVATSGQGSASGGAAASGTQGSSTSEETSSSASETSSGSGSSSRTSDAGASGASETSSSSAAAIAGISEYRRGGLIGALMFVAQMIL